MRLHRKAALACGGLCLVLFSITNYRSNYISQLRQGENIPDASIREPRFGEDNIIFVESSCNLQTPVLNVTAGLKLNPRQACALESAALANPLASIYLLYTCNDLLLPAPAYVQQLYTYSNIHMWHVNISKSFMDSPLEKWFQTGLIAKSKYPTSHFSDVLRYLFMWKYAGTYLDLDVVVLRSLSGLSNFVGAESKTVVAAGVLNFAASGIGHRFAEACLEDLRTQFRGDVWGHNGPGVITRVLNRACGVKQTDEMTPQHCQGFTVYPPGVFYPIPYGQWRLYFEEKTHSNTMAQLNESLAIHLWNKLSVNEAIKVGSMQPYGLIARKHCPKVYANCGDDF